MDNGNVQPTPATITRLREIAAELRAMATPETPLAAFAPDTRATELRDEARRLGVWGRTDDLSILEICPVVLVVHRSRLADEIEAYADTMDTQVAIAALTPEEATILETLRREHPMTVTQESLAAESRLSDRTVREHLKYLSKTGLVHQPRGVKKGYGLTNAGLNIPARR